MKKSVWVFALLAVVTLQAHGASWNSDESGDGAMLYTATANDAGQTLGQYCSANNGSCLWMVTVNYECDAGTVVPVLINSGAGALPTTVLCNGKSQAGDGTFQYMFSEFAVIDAIVVNSKSVAIVFPIGEDRFRVSRFSVDDAASALETMHLRAYEVMQRTAPTLPSPNSL